MLVACIESRGDRMRMPSDLPAPRSRETLASTLTAFATNLVRESCHPSVIATFRLAIAEATRSPEIAQALDSAGREAARGALVGLFENAQSAGLVGAGRPAEMAAQYLGLLWESSDGEFTARYCRCAETVGGRAPGGQGHRGLYATS